MTATGQSTSFEANRASFVALLNDDHARMESLLQAVDPDSMASFISANKLEFHYAALPVDSPVRHKLGTASLEAIEQHCEEQRERQHVLLDELWSLADTFESADIEFILLKGLYFAERYYGGVENRFSWDLDVLVRRDLAGRVDRLLRRTGYFRRSAVLLSRSLTSKFTHAFDYGTERPRFSVDLHWMLSCHPSFRVDESAIWSSRQSFELFGRRFAVLSAEYEVVSNALSTFRDIQRGAIRLRAFVDLYKVLEVSDATIDWDQFISKRHAEGIAAITVNILALVLEILDCAGRFPGAAGAVERNSGLIVALPQGGVARVFEPGTGALPNRAWTSDVYECSRLRVATWWLVSLPFRMAVYKSGRRYAIFKRKIHVMKLRLFGRNQVRPSAVRGPIR